MKLSEFITGKKGSLFRHYFVVCFFALLCCTIMLGLTQLCFFSQFFRQEKEQVLSASVEKACEITENNLMSHMGFYVTADDVVEQLELIETTTGATVFFCDNNGSIKMCSEGLHCGHTATAVPENVLISTNSGSFSGISLMGGFLGKPHFVYGVPFIANDRGFGYIYATAPVTELFSYLSQTGVVFLISTAFMLLAAFFIVNYMVGLSTQPLRNISDAALRFGSGEMTARVKVEGVGEIADLAAVFNDMADSIEELEKTRRSFVANVSHELRTPMTTISGYIDGILDGTIPKEEQEKYLNITSSEVKRLAKLSQSLLEIARMEASGNETNLVDMNVWDIIISVMLGSETRITEKNIDVGELDPVELKAKCDPDMLHQIIYNLVDNAIKFTPEGGYLHVNAEQKGDNVEISIKNSGSGISKEEMPRIFERFYKSDESRALDKTGTGLGLYIVKTLIDRMNGSITVRSEEGEYAEFCVSLPASKPAEPEINPADNKVEKRRIPFIGTSPRRGGKDQ